MLPRVCTHARAHTHTGTHARPHTPAHPLTQRHTCSTKMADVTHACSGVPAAARPHAGCRWVALAHDQGGGGGGGMVGLRVRVQAVAGFRQKQGPVAWVREGGGAGAQSGEKGGVGGIQRHAAKCTARGGGSASPLPPNARPWATCHTHAGTTDNPITDCNLPITTPLSLRPSVRCTRVPATPLVHTHTLTAAAPKAVKRKRGRYCSDTNAQAAPKTPGWLFEPPRPPGSAPWPPLLLRACTGRGDCVGVARRRPAPKPTEARLGLPRPRS